jgi:hypothetical protein
MYAMVATRPNIAFTVNFLGRFMANLYLIHLKIMLCLIRYISGTLSLGISYPHGSESLFVLSVYSDSDWAGDSLDRKSTGGYLALVNRSPVA